MDNQNRQPDIDHERTNHTILPTSSPALATTYVTALQTLLPPTIGVEGAVSANVEIRHAPSRSSSTPGIESISGTSTISTGILMPPNATNVASGLSDGMAPQDHHTGQVDNIDNYTIVEPQVGMAFKSEDDAYEMYNSYARKIGFSIRKSNTRRRADETIYQKHIVCSNQGVQSGHSSHDTLKKNASTRTSCNARVQFYVSREGVWTVQKVVLDHNHYLASPNKVHKLRSHRHIDEADKLLIGQIRNAGIKPAEVYEFFKEWYGGAENVPFSRMDCNNLIGRERKKYLPANDSQTLLEYLKNKQIEDPSFFYAIQIDGEDGRIANFFWADGQSIMDYACFGDAVSFDTTFQTNKFEMPFAPLLGTNHHKRTIMFGAALLYNETIESFVWLFNTFLTAMSGKHPSTIFTDQCAAMSAAIRIVFPNTRHRLCLWHIYQNAAKHLSKVIKDHPKFLADFKKCVYEESSMEYFDKMWHDLLETYELKENSWLNNLYELRAHWAAVFRDSFTADMTTTQRSEGMNNVFKKRFRRKLCLSELLEECERCAMNLRENELDDDYKSRHSIPVAYIPGLPMLITAAESYTRNIFSDFEEEFKKQFFVSCKLLQTEGTTMTYKVIPLKFEDEAIVVFNSEDITITCSCKKYECIGLLCKHALRVFNINEIFILPTQYIKSRWTKYAKRDFSLGNKQISEDETLKTRAARISRKATSVALKCSREKDLLDDLEKAIDKLNLEADDALSQRPIKSGGVSQSSNDLAGDILRGKVSIRVPEVIKGKKNKRTNVLEKKKGKKGKNTGTAKKKKGGDPKDTIDNIEVAQAAPEEFINSFDASIGANIAVPCFPNNMFGGFSTMAAPPMHQGYTSPNITLPYFPNSMVGAANIGCSTQGGYTGLLLGVHQDASASRKLHFDESPDN
ncbi:hypothetical protein U9M48_000960 [Paspalum notatum var. saurae]|uniref:SWIM-type domain-containing protein n=1 Tax=Paspalum notatum var. saurae TaxID=547442 RepID=A0AAQ3PFD2_PASNO